MTNQNKEIISYFKTFNFHFHWKNYIWLKDATLFTLNQIPQDPNLRPEIFEERKSTQQNHFISYLLNAAFLQMYAEIEEQLYHSCEKTMITNENSIIRFKAGVIKLGYDLSCNAQWEILLNSSKIRNCLLHANGRLDISSDRDNILKAIQSINKKQNECLKIISINKNLKTKKLIITDEFLMLFTNSCIQFFKN
jgi:hypothetical protein